MPESNEQGLVERLRQWMGGVHTLRSRLAGRSRTEFYLPGSLAPELMRRSEEMLEEVIGNTRLAAAALEAQSAQIAELQAEVERLKQTAEDQQALRLRREADLKRALDTARHDAMEAVAWTRHSDLKMLKEHWPMVAVIGAAAEKSGAFDVPLFAASPLSQGGQE